MEEQYFTVLLNSNTTFEEKNSIYQSLLVNENINDDIKEAIRFWSSVIQMIEQSNSRDQCKNIINVYIMSNNPYSNSEFMLIKTVMTSVLNYLSYKLCLLDGLSGLSEERSKEIAQEIVMEILTERRLEEDERMEIDMDSVMLNIDDD
jgi:hypothetical protein